MPEHLLISTPIALSYGGGRLVHSYSLFDKGRDPLRCFSEDENLMRLSLGDIQFVGRHFENRLTEILFVPEYPNGDYQSLHDITTFYGIIVTRLVPEPIVEVRAGDLNYRRLSWNDCVSTLERLEPRELSNGQAKVLNSILELDRAHRARTPNISPEEMRRCVGAAPGARISIMPLVLSYV